MTQPQHTPTGGTPRAINEMLTPTYWGSLFALILGLALTVIGSIRSGPPAHVLKLDENGLALPLFYGTLLYVFLFTLRYYCAVSVNVYGESSFAVFQWPRGAPRRLAFASLVSLVLLSVSSVGAVIALGVAASLMICRLMALISFLIFVVTWVLSHVDSAKYGSVSTAFGLGDLFLFALGPNEVTVIGLFVMTAILAVVIAVEFRRLYWHEFREQFRVLFSVLDG